MLPLVVAVAIAAAPEPPPKVARLKWRPAIDLPVTGALGVGWLVSEFVVKKQIAPKACAWCDGNPADDSFRSLFQPGLNRTGSSPSDTVSNVTWISSLVLTLGTQALLAYRDDALKGFPVDLVIIGEAVFAAMAVNQATKFVVARERPFVHALTAADKAGTTDPADNNLSFFSGHSTFTMSLAVAAGTVTLMHGYRGGGFVFMVGVPMSLITGVLRMSADKHNFTDVAVGWLVGAGMGFAIPWFFHAAEAPLDLTVVPAPGGIALAGRF